MVFSAYCSSYFYYTAVVGGGGPRRTTIYPTRRRTTTRKQPCTTTVENEGSQNANSMIARAVGEGANGRGQRMSRTTTTRTPILSDLLTGSMDSIQVRQSRLMSLKRIGRCTLRSITSTSQTAGATPGKAVSWRPHDSTGARSANRPVHQIQSGSLTSTLFEMSARLCYHVFVRRRTK